MDRVHARLLGPACPWVGHLLGQAAKLAELIFGVASDHGFRCGLRVDQYSLGFHRDGSFGLTSFSQRAGQTEAPWGLKRLIE